MPATISTHYNLPSLRDNIFQVQLATMTSAGIISLLATAISPLLTTCILWFLGTQLLLSVENWHRWANIDQPQTDITLDHSIKILLGAVALLSATFVVQLHVISQMVLLTTAAVSLSAYFIYPCMQRTQKSLNAALHQVVKDLEYDTIDELLKRGADPYLPDAMGNNAFHLAVQNNEVAVTVLTLLKNKPNPPAFAQIGDTAKSLLDNEVKLQWQAVWTKLQIWLEERSKSNFYPILQECKNLWGLYEPRLTTLFNTFVGFLRGEMSVPNNLHYKNNAGSTPQDLITLNIPDEALTHTLQSFFSPEGYQEIPTQPIVPQFAQTTSENIAVESDEHSGSFSSTHSGRGWQKAR